MADLRITCPHCNQDITCDELWAGHELQCPICQGAFTVPAAQPAASIGKSLVPPPAPGSKSRLSVGQAQVPAQAGRNIPVRNLTAPPAKKQSPVVKILIGTVVVAGLGVGGYYGFAWVKEKQDQSNAKSRAEARNSDGGQVGHIANLNNVLDATEPGGAGLASLGSSADRYRRNSRDMSTPNPAGGTADSASNTNFGPAIPPKYTLDVAHAKIPEGQANGIISGTNFVVETARIDSVGNAQVLRLLQGQLISPDREMLVYLHLKPGEKLGGQSLMVSNEMRGAGVPQVAKRWKPNPRYAPSIKTFSTGYAMKLELGPVTNDALSGKIFLALPDNEQSIVAGLFRATIYKPDPALQTPVYATPAANPMNPAASGNSVMDQRYGVRR